MDLDDCINNRRSVRDYLDKPVEAEKIEKILNAGAMAPSAMNLQPWRFTVVENKSKIRELSDKVKKNLGLLGRGLELAELIKAKEDTIFYGAPLLIFISAGKTSKWAKIDSGLAAQNMMLTAYSLGLGSCYIGLANSLNNDKEVLKELAIPEDCEIIAPLIFGYPRQWPKPKERKPRILKSIK
jgi:nitroreductase